MASTMLAYVLLVVFASVSAKNNVPTLRLSLPLSEDQMVKASEDTPVNSLIGVLEVVDNDPGPDGEVVCVSDNNYVGLAPLTVNMYKVKLTKKLDREAVSVLDMSIQCSDRGSPPLASIATFSIVVQDVNDNAPRFSHEIYMAEIPENEPDTTRVNINLEAIDYDAGNNGLFEYTLENANGENSEFFEIDPHEGHIYTMGPLDREEMEEITLIVHAIDLGIPPHNSSAVIKIKVLDLNDNSPVITTEVLYVAEGLPSMSEVGKISATDADSGLNGEVVFSIAEDQNGSSNIPPFFVRKDGTVVAAVPFDREMRASYSLYVKVTDSGTPPNSNVSAISIVVTDVNDNAPVFLWPRQKGDAGTDSNGDDNNSSVSIDWYCPKDEGAVSKASAFDNDEGENSRISYSIESINGEPVGENSLFQIHPDSGLITLRRCVRETDVPTHLLNLVVSDNGEPRLNATASLNITMDIDFTSLTSPIPKTSRRTTSVIPSSSPCTVASALLTFGLLVAVLFNTCHLR